MAVEIEWKFVVRRMTPLQPCKAFPIRQGYVNEGSPLVRARVKGATGFLTIKAPLDGISEGPSRRLEFEYRIPRDDAEQLIRLCSLRTEKTRYILPDGMEIDIFEGSHRGLVVAELEVDEGTHAPDAPDGWDWVDVSNDPRYTNRSLAEFGLPGDAPLIDEETLREVIVHSADRSPWSE